jgi:uncharacterized protein YutE (UPF0331/DUF86 family)
MTDPGLIAKKLGQIETCVRELRTLAQPSRIRHDIREQRFVEHTLQLAIQAALDVASHIVSDERLGEPRTNRELFDLLERGGWMAPELAGALRKMVGFRKVLVHGHDAVDLAVVEDVLENRLGGLLEFVQVIRRGCLRSNWTAIRGPLVSTGVTATEPPPIASGRTRTPPSSRPG